MPNLLEPRFDNVGFIVFLQLHLVYTHLYSHSNPWYNPIEFELNRPGMEAVRPPVRISGPHHVVQLRSGYFKASARPGELDTL